MTATFPITLEFEYTEMVVPSRCRSPRPVAQSGKHVVHVPILTGAQAPVVMRIPVWREEEAPVRFKEQVVLVPFDGPQAGGACAHAPTLAATTRDAQG